MSTVFTCENPQRVWNKYTRQFSFVPCRKCNMCLSKRAQFWTDKLNRESKCHPYTLFGTLTYAPEFLPFLSYDSEHEALVSSDGALCINQSELNEYLDYESKRYIDLLGGNLPYARSSDLQGFIKRLRERVRKNPSGESESCRYVRYIICYEYGETKLRPHAHFIIFTGSTWLAEHAEDVVASCWSTDCRYSDSKQLGRVDVSHVRSSASSYVASYITCLDSLPKIYKLRKLRPALLFSKHPSLGSLLSDNEEVRQLFGSGSVYRSVRGKDGEVLQVLWSKDICDRLYPRVFGFGRVSPDVLRGLYERSGSFVSESFDEFFWHIKKIADDGTQDPIYHVRSFDLKKDFHICKINTDLSYYLRYVLTENQNSQSNSVLHKLLSSLKRFALQSQVFKIDYGDYFDRIVDYWQRRDYALLKYQCQWQQDISSRSKDLRDFSLTKFDPEFEYQVSNSPNFKLNDYYADGLLDSFSCINLDCDRDHAFMDKVSLSNKVIGDGKNKHIKYEYLERDRIDSELKSYYKYLISKKVS